VTILYPVCPSCKKGRFCDLEAVTCPLCGAEATPEIKSFLCELRVYIRQEKWRDKELKRLIGDSSLLRLLGCLIGFVLMILGICNEEMFVNFAGVICVAVFGIAQTRARLKAQEKMDQSLPPIPRPRFKK